MSTKPKTTAPQVTHSDAANALTTADVGALTAKPVKAIADPDAANRGADKKIRTGTDATSFGERLSAKGGPGDAELFADLWARGQFETIRGHFPDFYA